MQVLKSGFILRLAFLPGVHTPGDGTQLHSVSVKACSCLPNFLCIFCCSFFGARIKLFCFVTTSNRRDITSHARKLPGRDPAGTDRERDLTSDEVSWKRSSND